LTMKHWVVCLVSVGKRPAPGPACVDCSGLFLPSLFPLLLSAVTAAPLSVYMG
jgi:hypothetical protein